MRCLKELALMRAYSNQSDRFIVFKSAYKSKRSRHNVSGILLKGQQGNSPSRVLSSRSAICLQCHYRQDFNEKNQHGHRSLLFNS